MRFGRQICGDLAAASAREWLVTDGLGGFAMGTVGGLRTRRYHGLLVVATEPPGGRMLGLAALDPVLVVGDARIRLAVHEWADGTVDPTGHVHLSSFELADGVPRWRWQVGDVILERELASFNGRPAIAIVHRLVAAPARVRLELAALGTWRNVHGERFGPQAPDVEQVADGFVFEGAYRVEGPGFSPPGPDVVTRMRARAQALVTRARADDDVAAMLALAADQFVVAGPAVVAGFPWFGDWSRDTMTSYEGLFLETGRADEGRRLLLRNAETLSEGMLANTADTGTLEYNTVDGTLWFLHAVGRHVERTGDADLAAELAPRLLDVVEAHVRGTRYGIGVDPADGLLSQGTDGLALTWMDARVDGTPVTQRSGKAVEVNALWINGLATVAALLERTGADASTVRALESQARDGFPGAFVRDGQCQDVVGDPSLRPNQLLAVSLPDAPLREASVVEACGPLVTSIGLRSLSPSDPAYVPHHCGGPAERDRAYHQGTVWPWLLGPYLDASLRTGRPLEGVLDGIEAHLSEWGLGSVSETADGAAPHTATGCPFQAWSVAEVLRARRMLLRHA
jgi:glycogen debranching enzyme